MKPILITTDGTITDIAPENGRDFQLQELYRLIGCDIIQFVNLADGRKMVIDEEGKLKDGFKVNHAATALYQIGRGKVTPDQLREYYEKKWGTTEINIIKLDEDMPDELRESIVGNVVVCDSRMLK